MEISKVVAFGYLFKSNVLKVIFFQESATWMKSNVENKEKLNK